LFDLNEEMPTRSLPGRPRIKRVKAVKSLLWKYLRSRPQFSDEAWQQAWRWAHTQNSPTPEQIACHYIALVLHLMKQDHVLRLVGSKPRLYPLLGE
jgi:hypothetical protein